MRAEARQRRLLQDAAHQLEAAHQALDVVARRPGSSGRCAARPSGRRWPAAGCRGSSGAAGRRGTNSRGRTRVLRPWSTSLPMTKCSCRSGRALRGWLVMKPPASAKLVVSMPLRWRRHSKMPLTALTAPVSDRPNRSVSLRRVDHQHHVDVVVQVRADAGQVVHHGDAVLLQLRARADARQHQQLRRLQRAGAQQHLARAPAAAAAGRRCAPPRRPRAGLPAGCAWCGRSVDHLQVGPAQVRRQVGLGGAEALAVLVRHLVHAHAFLRGAVEVGVQRDSRPAAPASTNTGPKRFGLRRSITFSGPPLPCQASAPRSLCSDFWK